jgi:diguanylate cyclase (GGDEF)-like protein/PAS domain S-box-containing protein
MKLLIADDHPANLRLLRAQLESEGHAVVEASNGVEALDLLEREDNIEGIISDILMPRMDGYRLCLEVRQKQRYAQLPFLLYTNTYNSPADRELALSAGADAYIAKPAPVETLLAAIHAAMGKARQSFVPGDPKLLQTPVLKQYSETLVRKLADKSAELERAYEGLTQTEARLSGMVESALDAIIAVNEQQKIVLFNAAAEGMFQCQRAQALGAPLASFIPLRFQRRHAEDVTRFANASGSHRPMSIRTRMVWGARRDGTEFPIEASVSRLDTSQGILFVAFIRDITQRYRAEQELARSQAGLRHAQQLAKLAHVVSLPDGRFESWSETLPDLIGSEVDEIPGSWAEWLLRVHPEDRDLFNEKTGRALEDASRTELAYRLQRGDDWVHLRHVMDPASSRSDDGGSSSDWFHTLQDVSEQKEAEIGIRGLNRVLSVLSAINALIVHTRDRNELLRGVCRIAVQAGQFPRAWVGLLDESETRLGYMVSAGTTPGYEDILKRKLEEDSDLRRIVASLSQGTPQPIVIDDLENDPRAISESVEGGSRSLAMLPLVIDGKGVGALMLYAEVSGFFDSEEMALLAQLAADISFALDHLRKSEQIHFLAHFDILTGLPNRLQFLENLSRQMYRHNSSEGMLAVVFADLERLRHVNETLGRAAGDELLKLAGERLAQANPSTARIGVDIFALTLSDKSSVTEVARAIEDLKVRWLGQPFAIAGEELRVGCRIGVAVFPGDGDDAEAMLRNAEAALRRTKSSDEHIVFYAPELNARAAHAMIIESRLRRAIKAGEFVLYYQPKVDLNEGHICGVEALIRWRDPERGLVPPSEFISVLEECGMIGEVGEWALHQALTDQKRWRDQQISAPRVAVNVSPLQLRKREFADFICRLVQTFTDSELELEVTESLLMQELEPSISALRQIRAQGVTVAVDDFGTGYSSLAYIAKLPITALKIDRSFIVEMNKDPQGLAIVSSIIALAHALQLKVIAEGVETEEQSRLLRLLRCDEAQGFLYSKPLPAEQLEQLLASNARLPLPRPIEAAVGGSQPDI